MPGVDALLGAAPALERAVGEIASRLSAVTVHVHAGGRSAGAGVIWLRGGVIVTNAHVARVRARTSCCLTDESSPLG